MHIGTLFALVGMLQGNPAAPQATDSTTAPDASSSLGARTLLRQSLLRELPIDDPREALTLVPGFVRRGTAFGIGAGTTLYLRGNGADAANAYIDGVPVRDQITGVQGIALPLEAIESIAVTPGPADASIADGAGGGVIAYTIRRGGARVTGDLRATTDAPFGSSSVGYNRFRGTVGGPAGARVSWFATGEVTGQRSAYRGYGADKVPAFVWGGVDTVVGSVAIPNFVETTGLRRPLDWITERRAAGKVSLDLGGGSQMTLTGVLNDQQQRFFPGTDVGDTALFSGAHTTARLGIVSWTQPLGSHLRAPALHVVLSLAHNGSSSGQLTDPAQRGSADPALGIEWTSLAFLGTDSIPRLTDQILRNIRSNTGVRVPFLNRTDLRDVQSYRLNPYGLIAGWPTQGVGSGFLSLASENHFNGRSWISWPVAARQLLRVGIDYDRASQWSYSSGLLAEIFLDAWMARPRRTGVFASDHADFGKITLDFGARFDHYTPGGLVPLVPGRVFTNPDWNQQSGVDDTAYANSLARVYRTVPGRSTLSPHLCADFAAAAGTSLRFAFGRRTDPPSAGILFGGTNSDLSNTSGTMPFGGDVHFVQTSTFEAGLHQRLGTRASIDLAGYLSHRALYIDVIKSFDDPANPGRTMNLTVPEAVDPIGGRGIEGALDWAAANVTARLAYTFEHSLHASTQALQLYFNGSAPATAGAALRGTSAVVVVSAQTGISYVQASPFGSGVISSDVDPSLYLYGSGPFPIHRLPWTKAVDLRLTRTLRLSGFTGSVFADIRNALNFHNQIGGFFTGATTDALDRTTTLSPEFAGLQIEASQNGALLSGNAIDLRPACSTWTATAGGAVDCTVLRMVERRFGNGDGIYDMTEQTTALNAYYEAFFGASRFYAPGRAVRVGVELNF